MNVYLGTLTGCLGCFPLDNEPYHSLSDSQKKVIGIRSLTEFGNSLRAPSAISALPPILHLLRLALKLFRSEPAISMFAWLFTPTHTSSPHFSTYVGSRLQPVLPGLHPGHGNITWFRVYDRVLIRPTSTRFPYGSMHHSLNLARNHNSPVHSAKGTPSPVTIPKNRQHGLRLLVGTRFQVLFHSPLGVLFTFPSRYWFTIGH